MSLRTLTRTEMRWAKAAFSAIFPHKEGGQMPIGICDLDLEEFLRATLVRVPLEPALGLRIAIWVVALAPIFVLRRVTTIHGLAPPDRERVVAALVASPIYAVRQLVIALKAIGAMLYAAAPAVRARMVMPKVSTPSLISLRVGPAHAPPTPIASSTSLIGKGAAHGQRNVA